MQIILRRPSSRVFRLQPVDYGTQSILGEIQNEDCDSPFLLSEVNMRVENGQKKDKRT